MRCGSGSASAANEWVGLPLCGIRIAAILASRAAPTGTGRAGRPAGVAQATPRSLRLEAQDVALSRLKHGFESRRERQINRRSRRQRAQRRSDATGPAPADTIALPPLAGEGNGMGKARAVRGLPLSGPRHIPARHDGALVWAASDARVPRGPSPYE